MIYFSSSNSFTDYVLASSPHLDFIHRKTWKIIFLVLTPKSSQHRSIPGPPCHETWLIFLILGSTQVTPLYILVLFISDVIRGYYIERFVFEDTMFILKGKFFLELIVKPSCFLNLTWSIFCSLLDIMLHLKKISRIGYINCLLPQISLKSGSLYRTSGFILKLSL